MKTKKVKELTRSAGAYMRTNNVIVKTEVVKPKTKKKAKKSKKLNK